MFKFVHEYSRTHATPYPLDVLPALFIEFKDIQYGFDIDNECKVIRALLINLISYSIFKLNTYASISWKNTYGCDPLKITPTVDQPAKYFAESINNVTDSFLAYKHGEFSIIRDLLCYIKAKGIRFNRIFPEYDESWQ